MPEQLSPVFKALVHSFTRADDRMPVPTDIVCSIQHLILREYDLYQAAGAPYGDSLAGFVFWLSSANGLTPSA